MKRKNYYYKNQNLFGFIKKKKKDSITYKIIKLFVNIKKSLKKNEINKLLSECIFFFFTQ
jgi:hypothetical protein